MIKVSWQFVRKLFLTSVTLTLVWFFLRRDFNLAELLMFSNWLGIERIAIYPVLYPQVVFQIMIMLFVIFLVPGMRAAAVRRPLIFSLSVLAVTVAGASLSKLTIDTLPLYDKLPHLYVWNFVLGWVFWAALERRVPSSADRLVLGALFVGFAIFMFPVLQLRGWETRIWLFTIPVLLLIWRPTVTLPFVIAHPILLTSQATLVIFFAHIPLQKIARPAMWYFIGGGRPTVQFGIFVFSMVGSVAIWLVITAFIRTWRRRRSSPGQLDFSSVEAATLPDAGRPAR